MRLKLVRSIAVLAIAVLMAPGAAPAQDTLSITGTFKMNKLYPTVGDDLAGVFNHGKDHWWRLTLNGVSVVHDYYFEDLGNGGFTQQSITRVGAASVALEFFGPDATVLNDVVSRQMAGGALTDNAVFELINVYYYDPVYPEDSQSYASWALELAPVETGWVSFSAGSWSYFPIFAADANGYPLVQPRRVLSLESLIRDFRNGNSGSLSSFSDYVDIGSDQNPLPPLQLDIQDASVREGDKGTTVLQMTVTLNRASDKVVTIHYQTVNGTATAGTDYVAASGTLTFQPGQTKRTIALSINGDHKRESTETFTVQLSNAVGALLGRSVGTVTIVNDD